MKNKEIFLGIGVVLIIIIVFAVNIIVNKQDDDGLLEGKYKVLIKVKDYGEITVNLDADAAPITVTNFVKLVKEKFYDGSSFHRIIPGFMIQGGAPTNINKQAAKIKGEFSDNGIENNISHVRGVISMGRKSNDYNSASSQFFIVHEDSTEIDGKYAAFGKVESGMEVVDEIAKVETTGNNGIVEESKRPIIEYIRLVED